jgi:hypothetical protein
MQGRRSTFLGTILLLLLVVLASCTRHKDYADRSVPELIDELRFSRQEELYYKASNWPPNLQELRMRDGVLPAVAQALPSEIDPVVRFNLVMLVNDQLQGHRLQPADRAAAGALLLKATRDAHHWVRTEAIWGLRFTGDKAFIAPALQLAENDPDRMVRVEAAATARDLGELDAPSTPPPRGSTPPASSGQTPR